MIFKAMRSRQRRGTAFHRLLWLGILVLPVTVHADNDDLRELQANPAASVWRLVRNDRAHNIQVFIRHEEDKPYRSFRVMATLDCDIPTLYRVLLDFPRYPRWYWEVRAIRLLARPSPREYYLYMAHNAPFDLKDRDVILHARVTPADAANAYHRLSIQSVPDYLEPQPGFVRMRAEDMEIRFAALGADRTTINIEGYIDPGSNAPSWAINLIQRQAPYANLLGLARMVQSDEYRHGEIPVFLLNNGYPMKTQRMTLGDHHETP